MFTEFVDERHDEISKLSKNFNYNNLVFHYKNKNICGKMLMVLIMHLINLKRKRWWWDNTGKIKNNRNEFKSDLTEIRRVKKSNEPKRELYNIQTLQKAPNKIIKFFGDFSSMISETKNASFNENGLKILTPKQMLQRLPISLAQLKAGNISENLLNEIRQIICSLYIIKAYKFNKGII